VMRRTLQDAAGDAVNGIHMWLWRKWP